MANILENFCGVSGQKVNLKKFRLFVSRNTTLQMKEYLSLNLQHSYDRGVRPLSGNASYLWEEIEITIQLCH